LRQCLTVYPDNQGKFLNRFLIKFFTSLNKVTQLGALYLNFLGLGSRLEDKKSRDIVFELAYEQGKTIVETLRLHIYREDETLFLLAMKLISKEVLKEMGSSSK